jgi:DNA end-binding protein Ku
MALLVPEEEVLVLNLMRFNDEIRPFGELDLPSRGTKQVTDREMQIASQLIEQLTEKWKPEEFRDTYFDDLKKIIRDKIEGRVVEPVKEEPVPTVAPDLFARLSESLELAKAGKNRKTK